MHWHPICYGSGTGYSKQWLTGLMREDFGENDRLNRRLIYLKLIEKISFKYSLMIWSFALWCAEREGRESSYLSDQNYLSNFFYWVLVCDPIWVALASITLIALIWLRCLLSPTGLQCNAKTALEYIERGLDSADHQSSDQNRWRRVGVLGIGQSGQCQAKGTCDEISCHQ